MNWIDTHAHIYLQEFAEEREIIIQRAREANVKKVFLPNIDSTTSNDLLVLCDQFPDMFYPMMGLHPCSVKDNWEDELNTLYKILIHEGRRFYAVGEIGLDLYWEKDTLEIQQKAFERQITWALEHDLPVVIHVREAFDESFAIVERFPKLRGVFHCFTGSLSQAEWIQSRNMFIGLGGVSTFKNSGMHNVIPHLNRNLVVVETDAPYLAPVPYRGKRNEPAHIPIIGQRLADLWNCSLEEVMHTTTTNAKTLFNHG